MYLHALKWQIRETQLALRALGVGSAVQRMDLLVGDMNCITSVGDRYVHARDGKPGRFADGIGTAGKALRDLLIELILMLYHCRFHLYHLCFAFILLGFTFSSALALTTSCLCLLGFQLLGNCLCFTAVLSYCLASRWPYTVIEILLNRRCNFSKLEDHC